jgi:16S rRNA (guanine527-N7)-methyltransferase
VGPPIEAVTRALHEVLEEARARGFLGPGPVEAHVRHAYPLAAELDEPPAGVPAEGPDVAGVPSEGPDVAGGPIVDLGSGGGVPGLVLAVALPATRWVLVESQERRARWLGDAARALGVDGRVTVLHERAEVTGRGLLRGRAAAVVSRGFGPPAVTAECAAPLLVPGGICWVSEPPGGGEERWPSEGLALLGLRRGRRAAGWVGLRATSPCPERYPRRVGAPGKRPLF